MSRGKLLVTLVTLNHDGSQVLVKTGERLQLPAITLDSRDVRPDVRARVAVLATQHVGMELTLTDLFTVGDGNDALVASGYVERSASTQDMDSQGLAWRPAGTQLAPLGSGQSQQVKNATSSCQLRILAKAMSRKSPGTGHSTTANYLLNTMSVEGSAVGWNQLFDRGRVGALSTAQGILTLVWEGARADEIRTAKDTLTGYQNDDGGWPVRAALVGQSVKSITESTLFCLWALIETGTRLEDPTVAAGIQWLDNVRREDGGWGAVEASASRTYPTAFALRIYARTQHAAAKDSPANWLRQNQNKDGGWGNASDGRQSSHPAYTAHAVLALLESGQEPPESESIKNAVAYLVRTYRSEGEPWPSASEFADVDQGAKLHFMHFTTPWALTALVQSGRDMEDPCVSGAIAWLLQEQHTLGYWPNELVPGRPPIWASHDASYALGRVKRELTADYSKLVTPALDQVQLAGAWRAFSVLIAGRSAAPLPRAVLLWNSVLTFGITVLLLRVFLPEGDWPVQIMRGLAIALATSLVTGFGPFVYDLIIEWMRQRRGQL